MKALNYNDILGIMNDKLANGGIFLTVGGEKPNTMTIGWAYMGYSWRKNMFVAMVRPQRHTFDILEKTGEFTVSIPTKDPMKAQLGFAGTASGRDGDKFDGHGLTAAPAQQVNAPIIGECGLHIECRVISKQYLSGENMLDAVKDRNYAEGDFHMLYFGEIVACYSTDE